MSIEIIDAVAKSDIKPSGKKFTLMALANYADEEWSCFPSVQKLSEWTSQGKATVRRHLEELEKDGLISRNRRRREDGTLGTYRYIIQYPALKMTSGQNEHYPALNLSTTSAQNGHAEPSYNHHSITSLSETAVSNGSGKINYTEEFQEFWKAYPTSKTMSKKSAFGQWKRLDKESRQQAAKSLPAFRAEVAKQDHSTLHAERYLSKRVFDNFEESFEQTEVAKKADEEIARRLGIPLEELR